MSAQARPNEFRRVRLGALFLFALSISSAAAADEARQIMFTEAEEARAAAVAADAGLLAPDSFGEAERELQSASEGYDRGRSLERIRRSLSEATEAYRLSVAVAKRALQPLNLALQAREAAIEAGAGKLKLEDWEDGERSLNLAAIAFERGDPSLGEKRANTAVRDFRASELKAIKSSLLTETRALIDQAERDRVQRYAPRTLDKARRLLAEAEKALEEDRYDTDRPRALAREAYFEARHAIHLARFLATEREKKATGEDLVLAMEEPLRRVAAAADIAARFDQGPQAPADQVIEYIQSQADRTQNLEQDLDQRTRQVFALEQEVTDLYERLGGVAEQRQSMQRELERQAMERQRLAEVEALFQRDEARVLRKGDTVIIRMTGIKFPVGSATVPASSRDLMRRLETSLRLYPDADITVAGHTDAFGGDTFNFELSSKRAESVRAYLLETLRIPGSRVSAVGYGETEPVASNDTPEGRAANRRIDIEIRPAG
ncbi:MAG: OmpA family protein [Gammaproteobacteria bacterium]